MALMEEGVSLLETVLQMLHGGCLWSIPCPGSLNAAPISSGCQSCDARAESHTSCAGD